MTRWTSDWREVGPLLYTQPLEADILNLIYSTTLLEATPAVEIRHTHTVSSQEITRPKQNKDASVKHSSIQGFKHIAEKCIHYRAANVEVVLIGFVIPTCCAA